MEEARLTGRRDREPGRKMEVWLAGPWELAVEVSAVTRGKGLLH